MTMIAVTTTAGGASSALDDISRRILEGSRAQGNLCAVVLAGGVGGARLSLALCTALDPSDVTVVVNVGDDEEVYGVQVSADLDTVVYTLAGIEGPEGWGRRADTWNVMGELAALGVDTTFRLGDRDLGFCLARTGRLARGDPLSVVVAAAARALGVGATVLPATDDTVRTKVRTVAGDWLDFQDYFVHRRHDVEVAEVEYRGAIDAAPAPGVLDAIAAADVVVIAPSNPPLSIWPILAVPGIRRAVAGASTVVAVSPLFGGTALKGPAHTVMASLGLPPGNAGVAAAYEGLLTHLVVDEGDAADVGDLSGGKLRVVAMDTHMTDEPSGRRFGDAFVRWLAAEAPPRPVP
jgi:LPPG:FO 2-phospho-L-lactate transferase